MDTLSHITTLTAMSPIARRTAERVTCTAACAAIAGSGPVVIARKRGLGNAGEQDVLGARCVR